MRTLLFLLLPSLAYAADCSNTSIGEIPLSDLGTGRYLNLFQGGLYPNGANTPPGDHDAAGRAAASRIRPLGVNGNADPDGAVVLLSVGMSNASREFRTFVEEARTDSRVDSENLVILNGAQGGATASSWASPDAKAYDEIESHVLSPRNVSELQVQAVWLKTANARPRVSLPAADADAFELSGGLGAILRALRVRYPNLQAVFLSPRTYAGYASTDLNPEPYAYESGFGVKWTIEAQIAQRRGEGIDPVAGDLAYPESAPWTAWGPYLWADGERGRSDGLQWFCSDFASDGTHPSGEGNLAVSGLLLDFFLNSPYSNAWFRAGGSPPIEEADVDVVSPKGGDSLPAGSNFVIRWAMQGPVGDRVSIRLVRGGNSRVVADSVPNSGSFDWRVNTDVPTQSGYAIEVSSVSAPSVRDRSDGTFSIVEDVLEPGLAVVSPNGGETLTKGASHTIRWSVEGTIGSLVRIELFRGNRMRVVANGVPNSGRFSWRVNDNVPSGPGYRIRVIALDNPQSSDESDSDFSIID